MGSAPDPDPRDRHPGDATATTPESPGNPTEFDLRAEALADSRADGYYDNDDGWPRPSA